MSSARCALRAALIAAIGAESFVACGENDLQPILDPIDSGASGSDAFGRPTESDAAPIDAGRADAGIPGADGGSAWCKRGIASNAAPSAAFASTASTPGISWWYDWANEAPGGAAGIEFDPMLWGGGSLSESIPAGSHYVLGFNEPNFKSQANLTPTQAAADWPKVEASARAVGAAIVSPGVNFCGSSSSSSQCSDPSVTDPYGYLKDFFAACTQCQVDYIAVHWYNCDLPSLRGYLEGNEDAGGGLEGFVQFGKPIWVTEFSCNSMYSVADQKAYMQEAVPYLEANPNVFRYAWFNAKNIPNAELANSDGSLTDLGQTYVALPSSCPR